VAVGSVWLSVSYLLTWSHRHCQSNYWFAPEIVTVSPQILIVSRPVRALEAEMADIAGMEAALFCVTGEQLAWRVVQCIALEWLTTLLRMWD
jgi:hypothetical protein